MFTVSVCGGSPVLSGRLFALIKFNRPVWVPSEPEHTGWQQSNADFHYLKLQRPNYIQSNQHWALQRVFIKEVQAEDLNLLSVKNDLIMSWFLTLYVYKAERVEKSCFDFKACKWISVESFVTLLSLRPSASLDSHRYYGNSLCKRIQVGMINSQLDDCQC